MPFTKNDLVQLIDFANLFKIRRAAGLRYQNIVIIGIICLFAISYKSKNNFIPLKDQLIVCIATTLLFTTVFIKIYKRKLGVFWAYIHNLTLGFIMVYLFIITNDTFSNKKTDYKEYYIEKLVLKSKDEYRDRPYLEPIITVKIDGKERKIILDKYDLKDAQKTRYVRLGIKDGFWNYPILKDIQLIMDYKTEP